MRRLRRKRKNKQRKIMIAFIITFMFLMIGGYAAFRTNLNITAKGNIIDIKEEVDSKVPTNELLFWGQGDSEENTLTMLKDKSDNNNDGTMYGFDNTNLSGYTDEGLVFDGINDYVDIGLANYDFQNSISYVVYFKINMQRETRHTVIASWGNGGGSGIYFMSNNLIALPIGYYSDTTRYYWIYSENTYDILKYYTVITIYDGTMAKIYVDGIVDGIGETNVLGTSDTPILIGANPQINQEHVEFAHMVLKEAMVYDRALTEDEVKTITEGFERKYK